MLLSVIIPFYQVEAYLGECLARAANLTDCELLLVDDCGTDGSAAIAAAFCAEHANARVLKREKNGGLSVARNTGLCAAQGEYVYFLDSDDLPEPDALMRLARDAKENKLDIAKARYCSFDDETGRETPGPQTPATGVMPGGALFAAQCRAGVYEPMVWQCVYRRTFLAENRLEMAEGLLFEDELFQAPALLKAQRAAAYEYKILRYRQRSGSIMASFARSSRWCESYLTVCRRLSALADTLEAGEAKAALRTRAGQIALSMAKNVPAYRLSGEVAAQVKRFVRENLRELTGYALGSGNAFVAAQGMLLRLSPCVFYALYSVYRP